MRTKRRTGGPTAVERVDQVIIESQRRTIASFRAQEQALVDAALDRRPVTIFGIVYVPQEPGS